MPHSFIQLLPVMLLCLFGVMPTRETDDAESTSENDSATTIAEFRRRLHALEAPILELAEKVRAAEANLTKDHPESVRLRAELRAAVQTTFETRQAIQRAELEQFTRRLQRLEESIDARDRIADKVIDRRIETLLNPEIEWEAAGKDAPEIPSTARARTSGAEIDPELEGDWELESVSGALSYERGLKASIQGTLWTMIRTAGSINYEMVIDRSKSPKTIDLMARNSEGLVHWRDTGIYEIRDGKLLVAWSAAFGAGIRPPGFNREQVRVFTWKRISRGSESVAARSDGQHFVVSPETSATREALISRLRPQDWGEPIQGLRLAVVPMSENTASDESLEVLLVVKNDSDHEIVLKDVTSISNVQISVRRTSGAQVETWPFDSTTAFSSEPRQHVLAPKESFVIGTRRIRVLEAQPGVPGAGSMLHADLLIVDHRAFEFRNAIYFINCDLTVNINDAGETRLPLHSGTVAIAFNRLPQDSTEVASVPLDLQDSSPPTTTIHVHLKCHREIQVLWPGHIAESANPMRFTIPSDKLSALEIGILRNASEGEQEVHLTIEPKHSSPEALQFLSRNSLLVEVTHLDIALLASGRTSTKVLSFTPGSTTISATSPTDAPDEAAVPLEDGPRKVLAVVRMSSPKK